jgi:hypothetical protein
VGAWPPEALRDVWWRQQPEALLLWPRSLRQQPEQQVRWPGELAELAARAQLVRQLLLAVLREFPEQKALRVRRPLQQGPEPQASRE